MLQRSVRIHVEYNVLVVLLICCACVITVAADLENEPSNKNRSIEDKNFRNISSSIASSRDATSDVINSSASSSIAENGGKNVSIASSTSGSESCGTSSHSNKSSDNSIKNSDSSSTSKRNSNSSSSISERSTNSTRSSNDISSKCNSNTNNSSISVTRSNRSRNVTPERDTLKSLSTAPSLAWRPDIRRLEAEGEKFDRIKVHNSRRKRGVHNSLRDIWDTWRISDDVMKSNDRLNSFFEDDVTTDRKLRASDNLANGPYRRTGAKYKDVDSSISDINKRSMDASSSSSSSSRSRATGNLESKGDRNARDGKDRPTRGSTEEDTSDHGNIDDVSNVHRRSVLDDSGKHRKEKLDSESTTGKRTSKSVSSSRGSSRDSRTGVRSAVDRRSVERRVAELKGPVPYDPTLDLNKDYKSQQNEKQPKSDMSAKESADDKKHKEAAKQAQKGLKEQKKQQNKQLNQEKNAMKQLNNELQQLKKQENELKRQQAKQTKQLQRQLPPSSQQAELSQVTQGQPSQQQGSQQPEEPHKKQVQAELVLQTQVRQQQLQQQLLELQQQQQQLISQQTQEQKKHPQPQQPSQLQSGQQQLNQQQNGQGSPGQEIGSGQQQQQRQGHPDTAHPVLHKSPNAKPEFSALHSNGPGTKSPDQNKGKVSPPKKGPPGSKGLAATAVHSVNNAPVLSPELAATVHDAESKPGAERLIAQQTALSSLNPKDAIAAQEEAVKHPFPDDAPMYIGSHRLDANPSVTIIWSEPVMMKNCWVNTMLGGRYPYSPSCATDGTYLGKQCFLQRCWCVNPDGSAKEKIFSRRFYYKLDAINLIC